MLLCMPYFVTLHAQINANFSTTNFAACGSLQTTFFDQSVSSASIISWAWELDGNTSSQQNPGAIFAEPGSYTICLTVTDVNGNSDTECKEDYITVYSNPTADFSSDIFEGCAPITVSYTDLSTSDNGEIVSWLWGLGGSAGVINAQNANEEISSTYANGGDYTVSLTVMDSLGCSDTKTVSNFINVFQIPEPNIGFDLLSSCTLPWEIQFFNTNFDPEVIYVWDFGNGMTYTGAEPPIVTYSEVDVYDITITMESGDCRDTLFLERIIDTDVTASFSVTPEFSCQGNSVFFTDESVIETESVLWDFGDGNTSTAANPQHTYTEDGCYDVTLIRVAGECSDTAILSCLEILPAPDVEIDIINQFNCTLPTNLVLSASSTSPGNYQWEFSDSSDVIVIDSNHVPITIEEFGSYEARLKFTDEFGCTYIEEAIPIDIFPFELFLPMTGPSGCAPLTFTLQDSLVSSFDAVSWNWSIGDPVLFNSTASNPTFTMPDTGRYDVQLIVENENGCRDTVVMEDYVRVGMLPEIDFSATPLEACSEVDKVFTDLSSDYADEWAWFADGDFFSDEQNPIIALPLPKVYDIMLQVSHNGCKDSLEFLDYLTILAPYSRFNVEYNCDDPFTVEVLNVSQGADSLMWTLRLSETDSLFFSDSIFGNYTFPDRGKYTLTHYAKNFETGCEDWFTDTIRVVDPIASYTMDTLRGCAPLEISLGDFSQDAFEYEYLSDDGSIDSIFSAEPTITFTEGGILKGPLLIITDIHECKDSFQLNDSVEVNRLDAMIDFTEVICIPDSVHLLDQSVDVLGTKIAWEWSIASGRFESSSQDTIIFIDSVGQYDISFKVEDDWGCKDSLFIPNAVNAVEIIPDFRADSLGCTSSPISFSALGDNGFVDFYDWDFGDGNTSSERNPNHQYAAEGTYDICLTMGDSRGCSKSICKENVVTIIDPEADFLGDPIFATCPPLLTNFKNNSQDATQYIWDFGDNSGLSTNVDPSHVYTAPGVYDVMLIAQSTSNCLDTLILEEYVRVEGPSGTFTFATSPTCIPITVDLFAESDGFYSYTWDYGNGVLDSVAGLVIVDTTSYTYTETGRFTPKLIVTDSIGCSRSFSGDPIIVNNVELDFTQENIPLCGPPLDVQVDNISVGTTDDVAYSWMVDGPQTYTSMDSSPIFSIEETGLYTVSLIVQYDNCTDTLAKSDFLEIADIPQVSFEIQTDEFCEDVNATFINTSTVDYGTFAEWRWDFGDGNTSNAENPIHQYQGLESRTITLVAITNEGCEGSFTASFDVLPSMPANAGEDELICIGDEITLNGEIENLLAGGSFYWEEESSLSCLDCLNPIANPQETTQYILVSIHPNGCESRDTIAVTVIPVPGPELSLTSDSIICLGTSTVIVVDNFNEQYNYLWNEDIPGQDCYEDCEEVVISPVEETTYYVTVFNQFGCVNRDSVTINVETNIDDFLTDTRGICEGESTTIEVLGGLNPVWQSHEDITCLTCSEIEVSPTTGTKYFLRVESEIGCEYEDSVQVIVVPEQIVFAGVDREICLGESVRLSAVGVGEARWSPEDIVAEPEAWITEAIPDSSGFISLNMTFDECTQIDSLFVTVYTRADIVAKGDSVCVGEEAFLTVEGRADRYTWLADEDEVESSQLIKTAETSEYVRVVGEFRTCQPDTAEALLYVYPKVDYQLPEENYVLHLNDEITLEPSFDINRNYTFLWSPNIGLDCVDCADPVISGLMENVDYDLVIIDEDSGCSDVYEINVRFRNECTQEVFHLPNIINTSRGGQNALFTLKTNNPEEFISMTIYDRWGNKMFTTTDIDEGWNGTSNGDPVANGVYVYKITLTCPFTNEDYSILGDVTVIR